MNNTVIVTADDFGLTQQVNADILETVDAGAVSQVSVLANGLAFDEAMDAVRVRPNLLCGVHVNLTEGKAVANPAQIPLLVDGKGVFRHTPGSLLLRIMCALPHMRRRFVEQLGIEIRAQVEKIADALGRPIDAIDGHQHVQMVPWVYCIVQNIAQEKGVARVRVSREPFFFDVRTAFLLGTLRGVRYGALWVLGRYNTWRYGYVGEPRWCIGILCSGEVTAHYAQGGVSFDPQGQYEIAVHPGTATAAEIAKWEGDTQWYQSPWRRREKQELLTQTFPTETLLDRVYDTRRAYRFIRFALVGALVGVSQIVLLYIQTDIFGWWYVLSNLTAWTISFLASFFIQRRWTFAVQGPGSIGQLVRYFLLQIGVLVTNTGLLYIAVDMFGFWYVGAEAIIALVLAVVTYTITARHIFNT